MPATAPRSNPTRDRQRSRPPSSGFHPAGIPATHWTTRCRNDSCSRSLRTGISTRVRTRASSIGSSPDHHRGLYRRRCCVARPSYLDHDLDLDLYSDYYANSNFNSALDPDIDLDLDLDLDVDVDMPFRSNHILPSPAAEQCMNPQLASRTVLRCERPYLDVDIGNVDRTGYHYGNVDEDMNMGSGSGRTYSYNYNPTEVRVKEEFEPVLRSDMRTGSGWVSPFESWQGHGRRPVQLGNRPGLDPGPTSTSTSRHTEQAYHPQSDQYGPGSGRSQRAFQMETEMGSKAEIGAEVDTRMGYDMQLRAGTALGYHQYPRGHQQTGSRSFDMQPMVVNMPPIQHPGPPRYTSDAGLPRLASQGQYQNQNQAQMQGQGQAAGGYHEEYAASTPSTTSSVYQYPGPSPNTNPNVHAQIGARAGWQPSGVERGVEFGMPDMESAAGTGTGQGNSPLKAGIPRTSSFGLGAGSGIGASGQMGLGDASGSGMGEASGSIGQGGQPGQTGGCVGASGSAPTAGAGGSGGSGGKAVKKKAAKACLQCQRAHLTCDDCECEVRKPQTRDALFRAKADR